MLTLKELKSMVVGTAHFNGMPSIKQLERSDAEILIREMVSDIQITVYQNGYVVCCRGRDSTVFRLQDCGEYIYSAAVAEYENTVGYDIFEDDRWYIRLYLEAEDRLNANYERKQRHHQISLDDLNDAYCREIGDFTWDGLTELLKQEDVKQVSKFLKMMTGKQQRVITLYFIEQRGTLDIAAELGVSYQAVSDMVKKAITRVRRKEGIDISGIPRGVYNHSTGMTRKNDGRFL